jgi:hypothetical protein
MLEGIADCRSVALEVALLPDAPHLFNYVKG